MIPFFRGLPFACLVATAPLGLCAATGDASPIEAPTDRDRSSGVWEAFMRGANGLPEAGQRALFEVLLVDLRVETYRFVQAALRGAGGSSRPCDFEGWEAWLERERGVASQGSVAAFLNLSDQLERVDFEAPNRNFYVRLVWLVAQVDHDTATLLERAQSDLDPLVAGLDAEGAEVYALWRQFVGLAKRGV